jgi:hypothetical protein
VEAGEKARCVLRSGNTLLVVDALNKSFLVRASVHERKYYRYAKQDRQSRSTGEFQKLHNK